MKIPKAKKMSSGNYFIRLRLGGEEICITESTEKECIRQAQFIKSEYMAGKRQEKEEEKEFPTLSRAIDDYIEARSNTLSPLTIRGYRIIQKNRFKDIMDTPVDQITDWQRIINREAGKCAPKTLKNAWGFVRSVVEDVIGKFPPEVRLPAPIPPDQPFLMPEEIKVFVTAVKDTKYAIPCFLALSSLRASEIEALDWKDIPQNPQFIRVSGAVVLNEDNKKVRKKPNKNTTSTRNVPVMIPELTEALDRDRKHSGSLMGMHQNSLRYGIAKICRENNLPNVGIHGLRHSFASLAYHLQIPEKIAMEIGGWSDATTMHKIYTHIAKSDISRYQTKMTDFFCGKTDSSKENGNQNGN